ncbi:hypothetical protein ACLOJK_026811 [Asimina triloba]
MLKGYVAFAKRGDAKLIDNSPNPTSEWKSRTCDLTAVGPDVPSGHCPSLVLFEGGFSLLVHGVGASCCGSTGAFFVECREEVRKERASSKEGALVDGVVSKRKGDQPSGDYNLRDALFKSRDVKLHFESEAEWSEAAQLREELEASRAEVTRLQASLREGDV